MTTEPTTDPAREAELADMTTANNYARPYYLPTPEEIAEATEKIRAGWPESRINGADCEARTPEIRKRYRRRCKGEGGTLTD